MTYKKKKLWVPDLLYHATTEKLLSEYQQIGEVRHKSRNQIYLSRSESHAWQVAHRLYGKPTVLIVNTGHARRNKIFFEKNHHGLWHVPYLPIDSIVNLHPQFQMQVSSGGIPLMENNGPKLALIKVKHHHSTTWEVSKGRLEIGENPIMAAKREVQEEMGVEFEFGNHLSLGIVRFVFLTPTKEPRLKQMHLFLLRVKQQEFQFQPAAKEGILEVDWFRPDTALSMIRHRTLRPIFRQMNHSLKAFRLLEES